MLSKLPETMGRGWSLCWPRSGQRLYRSLRMSLWFPHVPLFLGAALFGLLEAVPVAGRVAGLNPDDLLNGLRELLHVGFLGRPQAVSGILLLAMSFGLLMRSRLAWVISLLLVALSLGLSFLGTHQPGWLLLGFYNVLLLVALLLGRAHFRRSSLAAASLFAFTSVASVFIYAVLGIFLLGDQFSPEVTDLVTAVYFAMVTMSTVGFGDINPVTPTAMLFIISAIVLGITVFATSLSTLLLPLINRRMESLIQVGKGEKMARRDHYIIIGQTPLAINSYRELRARKKKVTLILDAPVDEDLAEADIVQGDATNVQTLEKAGIADAIAVLALEDSDAENAFIILAVKDLSTDTKTVTVANDADNMSRLRRVEPDLIIAPQKLGGELLAMALTGEKLNSEKLLREFLHMDENPFTRASET